MTQISQGNYDIAIKSLKRLQFFDDANNFPEVFIELADCYYLKAEYGDAYYYYDLASAQSENDSLIPQIIARKVSCKLYEKLYQHALIDLFSCNEILDIHEQKQMDMLFGITYFYLKEYEQSKQYFLKCTDSLISNQSQAFINISFKEIKHLEKRYNPKAARVMSIIIPGSGQIWVGDFRDGLNSLFLVSGFLTAGALLSVNISVIESIVIVGPWFQRYYIGGYQKAYEIAKMKQQKEKNKVLANIVETLEKPVKQ